MRKWEIRQGDWIETLREMPDESVQCCVTSPPYWGLRDYGTARWEGGDSNHEHDRVAARGGRGGSGSPGKQTEGAFPSDFPAEVCSCGAIRKDGQLGLERTPEEYVAKMVEGFREVRRVLRKDGTCWINLGDTYAGNRSYQVPDNKHKNVGNHMGMSAASRQSPNGGSASTLGGGRTNQLMSERGGESGYTPNQKAKDLVGIPWMVAFALRADGWYLRKDIIWHKLNPMPESVTDRPTSAHEYIFLMAKSERYYYDQEAIREPWTCDREDMRENGVRTRLAYLQQGQNGFSNSEKPQPKWKTPDGWDTTKGNGGHGSIHKEGREKGRTGYKKVGPNSRMDNDRDPAHGTNKQDSIGKATYQGFNDRYDEKEANGELPTGRNKRDVWSIATAPFAEAHFATFPPVIPENCIKAGTKEGDTVLDPFNGAGTTGLVATRLNRNYIGIELNPEYIEMSKRRITEDAPMFNQMVGD